ncbi:MAG: four helix bundle protein [Desulfuromonadales bacterium]|nr:four helix bundle protein [Desulfuromonadales bacterium]
MDGRPHRRLEVWKQSMILTKDIYSATAGFPKSEGYGLTSQMRRAAVSVPSNLAEGAARRGSKEFKQFINIAQGSLSELDTQLELAHMIGYLEADRHRQLTTAVSDISKMLFGLSRSVK